MSSKITSDLLEPFSNIDHGFLTRHYGNEQSSAVSAKQLCQVKQVHGSDSIEINGSDPIEEMKGREADILLSRAPEIAIKVRTADCVPLLFYDPKQRGIAAAHAGWRGSVKGVSPKTVSEMCRVFGSKAGDIRVALGPSIGSCCYEVDQKVHDQVEDKGALTPSRKKGRWMLDLHVLNVHQLEKAGIQSQHMWLSTACTACRSSDFFSYRKEGERAGRQFSFITLKGRHD